jgi:tRNA U34 5-methylaminomethyl-2-thiouridine-forming methyltransferase MnmC
MRICDVGLGAGFNVIETLKAAALNPDLNELEIYSFDLHLHGIDLLIESIASFPEILSWKPALVQLKNAAQQGTTAAFRIRDICPTSAGNADVKWNVLLGDAIARIAEVPDQTVFDAIFYDMFSCQSAPDFWTRAAIEKFARRLGSDGVFTTYSTATPVRAILLSLGCWVGDGAYVTTKMRSTIASRNPCWILEPLAPEWLTRFKRSGKPFFEAEDTAARNIIYESVVQHPQFASKV